MLRQERKRGGSLFTSECVTIGHPDKVSDYISDYILTQILKEDPNARVAVETMCSTDHVHLAGEVTTTAEPNYEELAKEAIKEIGYDYEGFGFSPNLDILVNIHAQSPDIAMGVDNGGAGDQGLMFGGAWSETADYMPFPISVSRGLSLALTDLVEKYSIKNSEKNNGNCLYPDGKVQVTVSYGKGRVVSHIDTVVVSVAHSEEFDLKELRSLIECEVIAPVLKSYGFGLTDVNRVLVNPTGKFVQHGPGADVGLTGRKIIVDTYGGYCPHGGGAFSGKDPSKVDRSGAYMARYIAKNIVGAGIAERCEVQLAYAIGVAKPVSVNLNMFGTSKYPVGLVSKAVYNIFDMTPRGIEEMLGLRKGFNYAELSKFGHFGDYGIAKPWEKLDRVEDLYNFCEENLNKEG